MLTITTLLKEVFIFFQGFIKYYRGGIILKVIVPVVITIFSSINGFSQQIIELPKINNYIISDSLCVEYQNKQSFDTALVYANNSLVLVKKQYGENDTIYANMLVRKMEVLYYTGKYEEALIYQLQAKQIRERIKGKENSDYASDCNNLALLYHELGDYKKEEMYLIVANKVYRKTIGKDSYDYAINCNSLAGLYYDIGNYKKAEKYFIEAKQIDEKVIGKMHPYYAIDCNNLALLYSSLGNYKKAEQLYLEAKEVDKKSLGRININYAIDCNNLAMLYASIGNNIKAEINYLEAKEINKKILGKEHPKYATNCDNLAGLYKSMGYNNKAESLYWEANNIREKVLGKTHPDYALSRNNLANLYKDKGEYKKAEPFILEAKGIYKKKLGKQHPSYGEMCKNLAILYNCMGNYKDAEQYYLESIAIVRDNIFKNFSFLSEKEQELYFKTKADDYSEFYSFALKDKEINSNIVDEVFNNTIINKGLLLKSSTAMRNAVLRSKDTTLINNYNKWILLKKEIVKLYSIPVDERNKVPEVIEEHANILEKQLVKSSKEISDFTNITKLVWQDVKESLKSNEVAIEFLHFQKKEKNRKNTILYCALIVTKKSKHPKMIPLFEEKQLEKIIGKFGGNNYSYINSIYGKNNEVNTELYNLIWKPMEGSLKGIKKVYLSPDGLLHKISFSAIAKEQNVYLCDAYDIEVKSTTRKITDSKGVDKGNTIINATLFGGITYDTDSTKQKVWNYLEGTKTETLEIDRILKKGKVKVNYYTNILATEEEFKIMASNSNIIHIATHGFFYPDPKEVQAEIEKEVEYGDVVFRGGSRGFGVNSFVENNNPLMRSGLVFAGANDVWSKQSKNDSIDDGVLTAQEVANIDMRKTELVVMSACETGLGDIKGSEGVYGLQRAFKMAGVKYEIMSLWQVPDKETEEFMTTFYKKLIKQNSIKQAFADTQKEMRKKYDPYFWAAFVLIE